MKNQNSNPARVDDLNVHLLDRRDPARELPRKRKRAAIGCSSEKLKNAYKKRLTIMRIMRII